jgi:hypothetical protein
MFAANPENPIAALLYGFTDLFLFPFSGLMPTPTSGGMVLEVSSFIAMIAYALLGWGLAKLVEVVFYRPRGTAPSRASICLFAESASGLQVAFPSPPFSPL